MNFWNRSHYVLFMIREIKQGNMVIFCMKCIPISNIINLQHHRLLPSSYILCSYEVETKKRREKSTIYYSIRPKSFPGNEHTGVWYMGSPLPCNSNLSVLYDFIQNPSPLCAATKHIKAKWWMAPCECKESRWRIQYEFCTHSGGGWESSY